MARVEGPVVSRHPGRLRRELAGMLRRDPDRSGNLQAAREGRGGRRIRPQEFALGSRPRRRACCFRRWSRARARCRISTPYFLPDKAFRARDPRPPARGVDIRVIVPGAATDQRWVRLASRRHVRQAARGRHSHLRVRRRHDPREDARRRRAVVGDRHDQPRQPLVRAQRRGQRGDSGPEGGGAAGRRQRRGHASSPRNHARSVARRPLWEKLVGTVAWVLERQQ